MGSDGFFKKFLLSLFGNNDHPNTGQSHGSNSLSSRNNISKRNFSSGSYNHGSQSNTTDPNASSSSAFNSKRDRDRDKMANSSSPVVDTLKAPRIRKSKIRKTRRISRYNTIGASTSSNNLKVSKFKRRSVSAKASLGKLSRSHTIVSNDNSNNTDKTKHNENYSKTNRSHPIPKLPDLPLKDIKNINSLNTTDNLTSLPPLPPKMIRSKSNPLLLTEIDDSTLSANSFTYMNMSTDIIISNDNNNDIIDSDDLRNLSFDDYGNIKLSVPKTRPQIDVSNHIDSPKNHSNDINKNQSTNKELINKELTTKESTIKEPNIKQSTNQSNNTHTISTDNTNSASANDIQNSKLLPILESPSNQIDLSKTTLNDNDSGVGSIQELINTALTVLDNNQILLPENGPPPPDFPAPTPEKNSDRNLQNALRHSLQTLSNHPSNHSLLAVSSNLPASSPKKETMGTAISSLPNPLQSSISISSIPIPTPHDTNPLPNNSSHQMPKDSTDNQQKKIEIIDIDDFINAHDSDNDNNLTPEISNQKSHNDSTHEIIDLTNDDVQSQHKNNSQLLDLSNSSLETSNDTQTLPIERKLPKQKLIITLDDNDDNDDNYNDNDNKKFEIKKESKEKNIEKTTDQLKEMNQEMNQEKNNQVKEEVIEIKKELDDQIIENVNQQQKEKKEKKEKIVIDLTDEFETKSLHNDPSSQKIFDLTEESDPTIQGTDKLDESLKTKETLSNEVQSSTISNPNKNTDTNKNTDDTNTNDTDTNNTNPVTKTNTKFNTDKPELTINYPSSNKPTNEQSLKISKDSMDTSSILTKDSELDVSLTEDEIKELEALLDSDAVTTSQIKFMKENSSKFVIKPTPISSENIVKKVSTLSINSNSSIKSQKDEKNLIDSNKKKSEKIEPKPSVETIDEKSRGKDASDKQSTIIISSPKSPDKSKSLKLERKASIDSLFNEDLSPEEIAELEALLGEDKLSSDAMKEVRGANKPTPKPKIPILINTKKIEEAQPKPKYTQNTKTTSGVSKLETVNIFTSLAGGGFLMIPRTNRLAGILEANQIEFTYKDLGTDEEAKKIWKRYGQGRTLPGVVKGKDDIVGNWEEIDHYNESYVLREKIYGHF
ncbi:uncharacterized protein ASCRUDRAFT_135796 [Ascoidea rubescens DSM 1968]|uniref:Uncharacterized protein n=1 Tax=Ascoidea rubescens DSM 1968 TaxID=1344418 RepID=A0A1D2VLN8_9ASCO|nr:hypothetical protein ASCRUDRAFT_135796 [Ascoidea rubescens DSM 1968]ODV62519.1 hypothetical protein ASCRUDRAFT_135796 [Ascoidea rubescens DSM 1968]